MSGDGQLDAVQRASQEQFSRQSERYVRGHVLENVSDVRAAMCDIAIQAPADVLDVATGAGHTGVCLAGMGHRVTVTDLTHAMLERAREQAGSRNLSVCAVLHPAEQFPFNDASFDLVTCRVAPHHFTAPQMFVCEVARVLRPGGWFLVIDGTVPDDEPEAEQWLHWVEKYRDPSHNRLLTPRQWQQLCKATGLNVVKSVVNSFKQPDLEWYFETAATSPANRLKVLELIRHAPDSAKSLFQIAHEDERIVWWWPRLTLIARKPDESNAA